MTPATYYLTRESDGLVALRQTRFKEQHLAGRTHEHDICGFARNVDEMRVMVEHVKIDTDTVDWTEP